LSSIKPAYSPKNDITFPVTYSFWLESGLQEPVVHEHFTWHEKVTFTCQDNQELKIFSHVKIFSAQIALYILSKIDFSIFLQN
jgi:hypothetical protein